MSGVCLWVLMAETIDPDVAFAALRRIRSDFNQFLVQTPDPTEADTRANLVDRVITEVCAWPDEMIRREPHVESGYIDYSLLVRSRPYVNVEAKRTGVSFSFPLTTSKTLKLWAQFLPTNLSPRRSGRSGPTVSMREFATRLQRMGTPGLSSARSERTCRGRTGSPAFFRTSM